jgi:aspartyl/glutamyl-tRNA(Asn/Gln) amidotransferase C subunit
MDTKIFDHLCVLSKLSFSAEEKENAIEQMKDIIALMDTVCGVELDYDDTKDGKEVRFADLREDTAKKSFNTEKLLSNTESRSNCYVIPKMMES